MSTTARVSDPQLREKRMGAVVLRGQFARELRHHPGRWPGWADRYAEWQRVATQGWALRRHRKKCLRIAATTVLQVGARFAGGTNLARRDRGKWGVAYDRTQHCRVPLWVRIGGAGTKKIPRGAGSRGCLLLSSSSEEDSGKTETVRCAVPKKPRSGKERMED